MNPIIRDHLRVAPNQLRYYDDAFNHDGTYIGKVIEIEPLRSYPYLTNPEPRIVVFENNNVRTKLLYHFDNWPTIDVGRQP